MPLDQTFKLLVAIKLLASLWFHPVAEEPIPNSLRWFLEKSCSAGFWTGDLISSVDVIWRPSSLFYCVNLFIRQFTTWKQIFFRMNKEESMKVGSPSSQYFYNLISSIPFVTYTHTRTPSTIFCESVSQAHTQMEEIKLGLVYQKVKSTGCHLRECLP